MGRRFVRAGSALLLLTLLTALAGCGNDVNPPVGPIDGDMTYGPPHFKVAFLNNSGFLATVQDEEVEIDPHYARGIGPGAVVADPAYGFLVRPGSTTEDAYFAAYDREDGMLYVLDNDGNFPLYFDGAKALENRYTFSSGGARIIYVREETNGRQSLVVEGVTVNMAPTLLITLEEGESFASRPSAFLSGTTKVGIIVESPDGDYSIRVYSQDGELASKVDDARGFEFSNSGSDVLGAYIDADPNSRGGSSLVIVNQSLGNENRYSFAGFGGAGATALSWSPDGLKIALFNGSQSTGTLVVFHRVGGTNGPYFEEVPYTHEGQYIFPFSGQLEWAKPSWLANSNDLVFSVRSGENDYKVIKTSIDGTTETLYEDISSTRYVDVIK